MSTTLDKINHSKRLLKDENAINKQIKIARMGNYLIGGDLTPHKFEKRHAMTCGDSNCAMCGNPRKFFKQVTKQERSFDQTKRWDDE